MEKKKVWLLVSIMGVFLVAVGVSFALWYMRAEQTSTNEVMSDCFKIEFESGIGITLNQAYPMIDKEGLKNDPYTFTLKNICNSSARYQINLETLNVSGKALPDGYLKVNLEEDGVSVITTKLEESIQVDVTIEGAMKAYKLLTEVLGPNEEKEFNLRLWMHEDVGVSDDSMNASFAGKISVTTSYKKTEPTIADAIKSMPIVTSGTGLYEVNHPESEFIEELSQELSEKQKANLKMTEYRYAGRNPNNYVSFNNELWRIIGLVNTPEGQRVKIRSTGSAITAAWNTNGSTTEHDANEWGNSTLMTYFNHGNYFNNSLTSEAKEMIDTITWNTGSTGDYSNINVMSFYNLERSNQKNCSTGDSCNDIIVKPTIWKGNVALMYPSDYGYSTSGNDADHRLTCLNTSLDSGWLYNWSCMNNSWIFYTAYIWTLTATARTSSASGVFGMDQGGHVYDSTASRETWSYPVVYLKLNIDITSGDGTVGAPYELTYRNEEL